MTDISIAGSLNVGPYKGYHGHAEFDADTCAFHGAVTDTRDVITFVGDNPQSVAAAFRDSIDDYLEFCKESGTNPERPFSGNFMVRATPALHRELSNHAAQMGVSLNQFVVILLEGEVFDGTSTSILQKGRRTVDSLILEGSASSISNYAEIPGIPGPQTGFARLTAASSIHG